MRVIDLRNDVGRVREWRPPAGVQTIHYDRAGLGEVVGDVVAFSVAEELPAHGEAVLARTPGAARGDV